MQAQISGAAGLATPEATRTLGWQEAAIGEYERTWPVRHADLRTDLSARIVALTGEWIPPEDIYTDGHLALAGVEGATFRLYHGGEFVLVRSCAYCATGQFESPKIGDLSDLGYALCGWRPLHEDCEDYSSEDLPDF